MTVIGFTGFAQSGKDTAASFLTNEGFKRLAFADALRDSVYNLNPMVTWCPGAEVERVKDIVDREGWDVAKVEYPEIRSLLQRMGTEVGRDLFGENFWVDRVISQITDNTIIQRNMANHVVFPHVRGDYVITDVRFPNEAAAVREIGGKVFRIVRPGTGAVNSHVSDTGIANLEVDGEIVNDGDLVSFGLRVLSAVR